MKKIWMMTALTSACLMAQGTQFLEAQLESKKMNKTETASNPLSISLILDAAYSNISFDNEGETAHLELPGLVHGGGHDHDGHAHTSLAGEEGFGLNYAELSIGASVDNYFDLMSVFHLTEDDFEIEEAYITTRNLPNNLRARIGKFKSDFGYLNNKHHHNYNFYDLPLVYSALLGDHGLAEQGFQVQYVLPAPHYVMVGLEVLKGENERSFGSEGFTLGESEHAHEEEGDDDHDEHEEEGHDEHEEATHVEDDSFPGVLVGYVKTSFDIGGGTLLAGLSVAQGDSRINHLEDEENPHAYYGENTLYGVDLTYKHYFAADKALTFQGEYIYREMDGTVYAENAHGEWQGASMKKEQAGFYTELVYQHDKNYRAGLRYSAISQNEVIVNGNAKVKPEDMYVTSAMFEYNPTEFSRIRLQYNHNSSLYDEDGHKNNKNELILQFNYAIGAHGAHAF